MAAIKLSVLDLSFIDLRCIDLQYFCSCINV
uniref:Uncharacterized protein n=1 Tax=Rhizophora mucronata TaxID=61149 RepID=A0A2P2JRC1_RHIMU